MNEIAARANQSLKQNFEKTPESLQNCCSRPLKKKDNYKNIWLLGTKNPPPMLVVPYIVLEKVPIMFNYI